MPKQEWNGLKHLAEYVNTNVYVKVEKSLQCLTEYINTNVHIGVKNGSHSTFD